ncbi:MAG TPA: nuclear transport factor 2 family protein [Thermoplasmata archaeon]|nr:nuclear transport factor 2 family protein [Thermoplasmata archaeon]
MTESDIARTALKFVNEINRHDVDAIVAMLTDDHLFVDGLGVETRGRERLRETWQGYFAQFPDYHVGVKEWFQNGRIVAMFGTASGTFAVGGELAAERRWKLPAAFRVVVREHQIVHWQVFADNEPVWKVMGVRRP